MGAYQAAMVHLFNKEAENIKHMFSEKLPWGHQDRYIGMDTKEVKCETRSVSIDEVLKIKSFKIPIAASIGYDKVGYKQFNNYQTYQVNMDNNGNFIDWMSRPTDRTFSIPIQPEPYYKIENRTYFYYLWCK